MTLLFITLANSFREVFLVPVDIISFKYKESWFSPVGLRQASNKVVAYFFFADVKVAR